MHIKQVVISGFRSFRNQCEVEPFSPKHNVIVGRNGSGKSNFFDAIQFVLLGPRFANLRQEDRQHILHEGAGSSVMAAYVEIIFDNSDGRIPIESDEVVLRRTVGHKKDEFFINRKRAQKSEVASLLESAGFSKANPYYIVQQGKVANLCVMKDRDRLNLLREVAGTTVYEERRTESLRILQDTSSKQDRIVEVITFIKERLSELDKEKDELREYEQLDKNRRALEYNIYDKELVKCNEQLAQMESMREGERERQHEMYARLREYQDELLRNEEAIDNLRQTVERLENRKGSKVVERTELNERRSTLEADLQEMEAANRAKNIEMEQSNLLYKEVLSSVAECEQRLARVIPVFESKTREVHVLSDELKAIKTREDTLYSKQGRGRTFSTISERDEFLQKQIDTFQKQVTSKKTLLQRMSKEINDLDSAYQSEELGIAKAVDEHKRKNSRIEEINRSVQDRIRQRNILQEERKSKWKELEDLQEQIQDSKQELERGKQQLNSTLPRHISQGIAAVNRIVEERGLTGYYGPLIGNIALKNDAFRTAVEVAAGNALFHIIVDTDEMAAFLMTELEKRNAGRLTFLPLNRLRVSETVYPDSNDVRALIDVAIDYEDEVELAIKQVFSKKLLARDLDAAALFSKEFDLDAITKDGDVVNRKGGFEGGYRDERISKIGAVMKIKEAGAKLVELSSREDNLRQTSESADTAVNEAMRELQKLEAEREHLKPNVEQLLKEISNRSKQLEVSRVSINERKNGYQMLQKELEIAEAQIVAYKDEQGSPLHGKLSDKERTELREIADRKKILLESIKIIEEELIGISSDKDSLRAHLKDNLYKRRDELQSSLSAGASAAARDFDSEAATCKAEKSHIENILLVIGKDIDEIDRALDVNLAKIKELDRTIEQHKAQERTEEEKMGDASKIQDTLLNKRTILLENSQQKQRLIRELGTLPRKELEDFKALSEKQLLRHLREVNEQLKKYASVNRKALDQYISFSEQRQLLEDRRIQLEDDRNAIKTLLVTLDQQKEEAILRTFKGVSHYFTEVFRELVPGGDGVLVMKTSDEIQPEDEETEAPEVSEGSSTISKFQGVQVRVSFSGGGQQYEMQQLSGGQKALVALALIFAIQRCDPAPFYLFDEVDQALDTNYRAGVARLIQRQTESKEFPAQFITTTFRPELVEVSHKCYGIALQNKVSSIYPLEKDEAQNFVTSLMNEEEAVGAVSAIPAYNKAYDRENEPVYDGDGMKGSKDSDESNDDDDEEIDDEDYEALQSTTKRSSKRNRPQIKY